jgi:hypothetical protein
MKPAMLCAGCNRPILDRFLLNVLDRSWHAQCVVCYDCTCALTEKCYAREDKLYCKEDFYRYIILSMDGRCKLSCQDASVSFRDNLASFALAFWRYA